MYNRLDEMSRARTPARTSSQVRKRPTPRKRSSTEPFLSGKSLIAVLCVLLAGATIALLGLTYKPDTDTLRRSSAVELARTLARAGARVRAYDPAISVLPADLKEIVELAGSVDEVLAEADAAIVATEWPQFGRVPPQTFVSLMREPVVIDARRILEASVREDPRVRYYAIGLGTPKS